MDLSTVYSKTAKGVQAITQKGNRLPAHFVRALSLVDGKATVEDILEKAGEPPTSALPQTLANLAKDGYLKAVTPEPLTLFSINPDTSASMVVSETVDETFFKVLAETEARRKLMKEAAENPQAAQQKSLEKAAAMADEEAMRRNIEAREAAADEERSRQEAVVRKIAAVMAQEEAAIKARREAESQALLQKIKKDRADAEERTRREVQEKAAKEAGIKAAAERKAREEAEESARREAAQQEIAEAQARDEAERKARREAEEQIRLEKAKKDRAEAEERERREKAARDAEIRAASERKAREEAEERARREAQEKAAKDAESRAEAERTAREAAEEHARQEAERLRIAEAKAREEAEEQALREKAEKDRAEAEDRARREAQQKASKEATQRAIAERKAQEAAAAIARKRERAEARAKAAEEEKTRAEVRKQLRMEAHAREEAERNQAREEAEKKAKTEADERKRLEAEAEIRASEEAAEKARVQEDARIKAEAEAIARNEAERKTREEAETRKKREAEVRAIAEAEEKACAEEAAQAKANAEVKAREEAEARTIAEAEERARREAKAEIRAQEEVQTKARAQAEQKAREDAAQEERERAEQGAKARILADARAEEAKKSRQKPQRLIRPAQWIKATLISLAALILLSLLLLQVMSLNLFIPRIEKLASDRMHEPVSIHSLRASLWPAPHLRLDGVRIGKLSDIKIPTVRVTPELAAFFGETKTLEFIEVESLAIDQDILARAMTWAGRESSAEKILVRRIALKAATLEIKGMPPTPFEADIALAATGKLERATLQSADKKIKVTIAPKSDGVEVNIAASDWQPPFWPNMTFTELSAKGMATSGMMRISEIESRLFSGKAKGSATIKWGERWSVEGELDIENILLAGAMPALTKDIAMSGKLDAKTTYSMQSGDLATLFDNPRIKASFKVRDGAINNIDLARAIQPRAMETTGGKTLFASLSGNMTLDGKRYQYRQMNLDAGLLSASGEADIMPNKQLTGKASVEMKLKSSTVRANLSLSGDLKQPVLRR
jgi:hypothetical protein